MIVDVFLSRKSEDAPLAKQLYDFLTKKGVKVFESDHSLQEVGNADYSRAIDDALIGTRHLIVIGSSVDNISSPWVEAEWRFFLNRKRSGKVKGNILTVVSKGLKIDDLPPSLQNYEVIPLEPRYYERIYAYVRPVEPIPVQPELAKPVKDRQSNPPALPDVDETPPTPPTAKPVKKRKSVSRPVAPAAEPQPAEPVVSTPVEGMVVAENEVPKYFADRQSRFNVFISYSSKDKAIADPVVAGLEANGIRCWIAPRDIEPGENWASSVIKSIREADVFMLILTAQSNQSNRVLREVEQAVSYKKSIVCFRTEQLVPSYNLDYFLGSVHAIEAANQPPNETDPTLVKAIRNLLIRPQTAVQLPGTPELTTPAEAEVIEWREKGMAAYTLKNYNEALVWFQKAAEKGDAEAQKKLGDTYSSHIQGIRNLAEAATWYRKAADQGHIWGQYDLGMAYQHGNGVDKDIEQAKHWYQKAAAQGNTWAQTRLKEIDDDGKSWWQRLFG